MEIELDATLESGEVAFTVGVDGTDGELVFEFDDFELREKP